MKNKFLKLFSMFIIVTMIVTVFSPIVYGKSLRVNAVSAIAIDSNTGVVLFEQNAHKVIPMASTTKIITCLVALKYGNLNQEIQISKNAATIRGSKVGYKSGEKVTLKELLYGLMLKSGNDCAIAIAEGMCGSIEKFCALMNEYAFEIGLMDSHFESPHGLDSVYHYSSSYDLAIATMKAKEIKEFNEIVSAKLVEGNENGFTRSFQNINKIIYQIPEANGVKTGYTGNAGKCLVSSIKYDNSDIIIVTLNCNDRWNQTKKIYDYVKENYTFKKVVSKDDILGEVYVENNRSKVQLKIDKDIIVPVKNDGSINKEVRVPKYAIKAPVKEGDEIGILVISSDKEVLMKYPMKASNSVNNKKVTDFIKKILD
ncbi:D-alanyl-D-alanine carboxypeptidase family protein [Clostridium sp.]|uniref:D-alanyl-D-alanine carboxypeptidase family protein n=1 Tax=Clostridium sp. TaxID=1506 RepID=UPI002FC847B6